MKKIKLVITCLTCVIVLCSCEFKAKEYSNVDCSETINENNATVEEILDINDNSLETFKFEEPTYPKVTGEISNGIKLDVSEFDRINGLVNGKVLTFKNIGEKVSTIKIPDDVDGGEIDIDYYNTQVGILDCKTGEKTYITDYLSNSFYDDLSIGFDGKFAYIYYLKTPTSLDAEVFNYHIKQINIETNEVREFSFNSTSMYCQINPLGTDSLLIQYYDDLFFDDDSMRQDLYVDLLDLSTGKIENKIFVPYIGDGVGNGSSNPDLAVKSMPEKPYIDYLNLSNISEDKAYFICRENTEEKTIYSIKIFDTKMNLLNNILIKSDQFDNISISLTTFGYDLYINIYENSYGTFQKYFYLKYDKKQGEFKQYRYDSIPDYDIVNMSNSRNVLKSDFFQYGTFTYENKNYLTINDIFRNYSIVNGIIEHQLNDIQIPITIKDLLPIPSKYGDGFGYMHNDNRGDYILFGLNKENQPSYYYLTSEQIENLISYN